MNMAANITIIVVLGSRKAVERLLASHNSAVDSTETRTLFLGGQPAQENVQLVSGCPQKRRFHFHIIQTGIKLDEIEQKVASQIQSLEKHRDPEAFPFHDNTSFLELSGKSLFEKLTVVALIPDLGATAHFKALAKKGVPIVEEGDLNVVLTWVLNWVAKGTEPRRNLIQDIHGNAAKRVRRNGRQAVILLAGHSGHGKSKTVNRLVGQELLSVGKGLASTTKVIQRVKVRSTSKELSSEITVAFDDTPGLEDTTFEDRALNAALFHTYKLKHFPDIYPNIILLVAAWETITSDAHNKPDHFTSAIGKTIYALYCSNLVDDERANIVVVVTKSMSCFHQFDDYKTTNEKNAQWRIEEGRRRGIITDLQRKLFPKSSPWEIVFIENGGGKDMSAKFPVLPDGQLSHQNLYDAIQNIIKCPSADGSLDLVGIQALEVLTGAAPLAPSAEHPEVLVDASMVKPEETAAKPLSSCEVNEDLAEGTEARRNLIQDIYSKTTKKRVRRNGQQVVILLAGNSGHGKSKTINRLIGQELLGVGGGTLGSTTKVIKRVQVHSTSKELSSEITVAFDDTPSLEDNTFEHRESNASLLRIYKLKHFPDIYPNVILLVVAWDSIIPDAHKEPAHFESALGKTIYALCCSSLVDDERTNIVVVITKSMSFPDQFDDYKTTKEKNAHWRIEEGRRRGIITDLQRKLFPRLSPWEIVFIENGGGRDMKAKLPVLPDGQLSHQNLYDAIHNIIKRPGSDGSLDLVGIQALQVLTAAASLAPLDEGPIQILVDASKQEMVKVNKITQPIPPSPREVNGDLASVYLGITYDNALGTFGRTNVLENSKLSSGLSPNLGTLGQCPAHSRRQVAIITPVTGLSALPVQYPKTLNSGSCSGTVRAVVDSTQNKQSAMIFCDGGASVAEELRVLLEQYFPPSRSPSKWKATSDKWIHALKKEPVFCPDHELTKYTPIYESNGLTPAQQTSLEKGYKSYMVSRPQNDKTSARKGPRIEDDSLQREFNLEEAIKLLRDAVMHGVKHGMQKLGRRTNTLDGKFYHLAAFVEKKIPSSASIRYLYTAQLPFDPKSTMLPSQAFFETITLRCLNLNV
ncbi:hypothetical protein C8J57DRAFT_1613948 [Mycena rebaudengoi]|nr:hypothetical protein C8J57DRAFT_1613948 [Mycena rebaudengoi]